MTAVLYANTNHPELKVDYPNWNERCKQILKKWRALSPDKRTPYLQKAKENRACSKKSQQVRANAHIFKQILKNTYQTQEVEMHECKRERIRCASQLSTNNNSTSSVKIFFKQMANTYSFTSNSAAHTKMTLKKLSYNQIETSIIRVLSSTFFFKCD